MEAQVVTIDQPFHAAYEKFIEITGHLRAEMACAKTHSAIEASLETHGRERLRWLRPEHVANQGSGRVGAAVCGSDGVGRAHKRDHRATGSKSVCGAVRVARPGESQRGVTSLFPRDAPLHLPVQSSAHRLQKRVAAKRALDEVAHAIATATAVRLGKRQVEPSVDGAAQDFDAFYAQPWAREVPQPSHAKPMQVVTFDGKGVVRRPEAWREATRKKAEASAKRPPSGFARQEQSHRKRRATVAGISQSDRPSRCPQTVTRPCAPLRLVPRTRQPAPQPGGKKRWARRAKPMQAVVEAVVVAGRAACPRAPGRMGGIGGR